jgi:hypothetical protein
MAGLDPAIRRDTKIGANRGAFAAVASDRRVNPRIKSGGGDDDERGDQMRFPWRHRRLISRLERARR